MKSNVLFLSVVATALVLALCLWLASSYLTVKLGYSLVAEFQEMPNSDSELEKWLSEQPGVNSRMVLINRTGNRLFIVYDIVQNLRGEPPLPRIDEKCRQLGYVGELFHDDLTGREDLYARDFGEPYTPRQPTSNSNSIGK